MKLSMKSALLTAAVAVLSATSVSAQNTDNDVIDVLATVETAIDVTGAQDLDFGAIIPGFGSTVLEKVMAEYFETPPTMNFAESGVVYELTGTLGSISGSA